MLPIRALPTRRLGALGADGYFLTAPQSRSGQPAGGSSDESDADAGADADADTQADADADVHVAPICGRYRALRWEHDAITACVDTGSNDSSHQHPSTSARPLRGRLALGRRGEARTLAMPWAPIPAT